MSAAGEVVAFSPRLRGEAPGHSESGALVFDVLVPEDLVYFRGHFDGDPILAAVVQLDVLVLRAIAAAWPELTRLRRVTRLRFRVPIRPGDALEMRLDRAAPARVAFELLRGGTSCSAGTLHFAVDEGR